jgi:hypothetical protein
MERPAPQSSRLTREARQVEAPVAAEGLQGVQPLRQGGIILVQQLAGKGRAAYGVPPGRLFPTRQHLMPQAIAEVSAGGVRGVLAPGHTGGAEQLAQFGRAHAEQGPQEPPAIAKPLHGTRRRQTRGTAAAGQPH